MVDAFAWRAPDSRRPMHALRSLRVRLLLLVVLVAAPAFALTLRSGIARRNDGAAHVREQGLQVARGVAEDDAEAVTGTEDLLLPIATLAAAMPDLSRINPATCSQYLAAFTGPSTIYASVGVATANGDVVCTDVTPAAPVNVADRQFFQEAVRSGRPSVGRVNVDRASGKRTLSVALPVGQSGASPRGVVYAAIDLEMLQPSTAATMLPAGSFVAVTDRDGTVLGFWPDQQQYVGTSMAAIPLFQTVRARHEGTTEGADLNDVPSLVAFTPLPALGGDAYALVGIPSSVAFANADRALTHDLLLLAALAVLGLVAAWFVSDRFIVRPIDQLVAVTQRMTEGDLTARVGPGYAGGEFTLLGRSFDAMAGELERRAEELRELNRTLERRVADRTAELSDANGELEAFTYSVSHDLRAPLRTVDGFSEILAQEYGAALDPEARRYITLIRGGARQMGRLIDDLLQFSRVGRAGLTRRLTSVDAVVHAALDEVRPSADGRRVEVTVDDLGAASIDPTLMRQVYVNLLSNAVKFTRTRDVARIEVGREPNGGSDAYFVRDNGVGFDMANVDRLFGVFQRLHLPEEYEGTGVGLAIVQRIIARHGGRIWADAALDRGATFYFTLGDPPAADGDA
jgi:signal transduction histidine kinase